MAAALMGTNARGQLDGSLNEATQSTWRAGVRTTLLLATLTGLLVLVGQLIGGPKTALTFLFIAFALNFFSYFFSDKIALRMSRAKPLPEEENPRLHQIVRELAQSAGLPMPRLYLIPASQPNAFATGRNPRHAAVAVTQGITQLLSESELRGVLAHELAHIRNHDILIQTVAAAIGGAITWIGYALLFMGGDDDSPFGLIGSLAMFLLAPIAAGIIQMSISRQREFAADATGARISGSANALADALERLQEGAKAMPMEVAPAAEPLYIVKPFSGGGIASLFSTHPPIEERVRRLRAMGI
jgi:heat shock protein HtpX